MNDQLEHNISFGEFELDAEKRRLLRGGEPVALNSKTFDLLAFLAENNGRVVSKDEIYETIWGGRLISEATLTSCINAARTAIGDSGRRQRRDRSQLVLFQRGQSS